MQANLKEVKWDGEKGRTKDKKKSEKQEGWDKEERGGTDGVNTRANSRAKWVVHSPDSTPYGLTKPYTARQYTFTHTCTH